MDTSKERTDAHVFELCKLVVRDYEIIDREEKLLSVAQAIARRIDQRVRDALKLDGYTSGQ